MGNLLTDNTWYDDSGHVLKSQPAGVHTFTKSVYDGLGRVTTQYIGYDLTETSYADAGSVTDDTILEQVETAYDAASNVIKVTRRLRYHNTTGTGPLGSPSSAAPLARVMYTANWQDALGRLVATADYGTNGGTALVRPSTIPARSDTVLVSTTAYDNTGAVSTTTDPAGTCTCFSYDAAGREVQRVLNCKSSSSSSNSSSSSSSSSSGTCPASDDTNVTIQTSYNADGNVSSVTAVNATTGNQVTQYVYGTTLSDSDIASSLLKRYEVLPDSASGSDQLAFQYNRQGEVKAVTDQMDTVHSFDFDLLGRRTEDRITTLGSGVDGSVRRIETAYEVRGMVQLVTSYDNATVGQGNVVNQVQLEYNSFAQLVSDYQSHSGAVNTSTTPVCQYAFADGSGNTIRPTTMTYPNGRVLNYDYGSSGGMNDALSRLVSLIDNDGVTHLADYSYLGQDLAVQVTESQPSAACTLVGTAGGNDPDTGDIYHGLDRFGRIKDLLWYNTGTLATLEAVQHGYDRAGNRLYRSEPADSNDQHDELYGYEGLYRVTGLQRGGLNATKTALSSETFAQCWGLDASGNWSNFRQDDNGDDVWDLVQNRTANTVNEISGLINSVGASWVVPAYNAAGNLVTLPQPGAPGQSYTATYDAWNRLVRLSAGGNTVAAYQYDGLKRRTVKLTYTGGVLSVTRDLFYTESDRQGNQSGCNCRGGCGGSCKGQVACCQVVEERINGSALANRQMVWGLRYPDDLVLRDRDATGSGTLNERLYALQDSNWNVTALADTSGVIQERYAYDAYGIALVLTGSFTLLSGSHYDWETRYAGYRWDGESGLYYVRRRHYHPLLGCWLQRDPLGLSAGPNLYEYAAGNALNHTDPSGEFLFLLLTAVAVGLTTAGVAGNVAYKVTGNSKTAWKAAGAGFALGFITVLSLGAASGWGTVALAGGGTIGGASTLTFVIATAEATAKALAVGALVCVAISEVGTGGGGGRPGTPSCLGTSTCADFGCREIGPGFKCEVIGGGCECMGEIEIP